MPAKPSPPSNGAPGTTQPAILGLAYAAWARILVLFLALASVKLALLVGLRKHIYDIHWRVASFPETWCNYAAFYLFVCLGVLSLLGLARHCGSVGLKAVRAANGVVLGLGLIFIFLTFHVGDKNYIYPILTGLLKWTSLGPYLSLDLCFRPPFLGAWLLGYVLVYYVLVRTGQELWALHLTLFCGGVYTLLNLRELVAYRNELLLVDCLGVVSVLAATRSTATLPNRQSTWLLAPGAWSLCFATAVCCLAGKHPYYSLSYFLMLVAGSLILFAAAIVLAQKCGYLGFWSSRAFFYFSAFLLLANHHHPMGANYNNALCLGLEFPRYFNGEVAVAAVLALGAGLYCRFWPGARLWWLDVLSLTFIAMAFISLQLSRIIGVRLEWDVLALGDEPDVMWLMAHDYLPGTLAALAILGLGYVLAVRLLQRWQSRRQASAGRFRPSLSAWQAVACFVLLGMLGSLLAIPDKAQGQGSLRLVQTSPWWKRVVNRPINRGEFLRSARALGLGDLAPVEQPHTASARRDLNVVLILMESSFNRHLSLFGGSEQTQPLLSRYKDRMELFPNFFSTFAGSIQARFATFTGLYPVRDFDLFTLQRVKVKSLFEALHDNGYTCSLFFSSSFNYTGFGDFLSHRGLSEMYDVENMPGLRRNKLVSWGLYEEETLGAIRSQLRKYAARDQRFFLTYIPAAPHYPYDAVAARFRRFEPTQLGDCTPFYLNGLLTMDWVMASILDQLKASGLLDQTLVIITNDHGERTGENGGPIGHGWFLTPELANTPLIVMDPQNPGYRLNYTIGSQVDVLPTVLDLLKIPLPPRQLYEGRSLYAPAERDDRIVYLNSYEQYGMIAHHRFIRGSRKADKGGAASGPKTVYTISNRGSMTRFTEEPAAGEQPWAIGSFDDFQANLLRNYSFYCEEIAGAKHIASLHPEQQRPPSSRKP